MFTTPQGGPIDPTNLTRAFNTLLRKAGLRRIRFHDLRHSTATLLLEHSRPRKTLDWETPAECLSKLLATTRQ